jgi:hypothetical protein
MDIIGGLHETTARLQQAAGTTEGAPLTAYAEELLDGLRIILAGFPHRLNDQF